MASEAKRLVVLSRNGGFFSNFNCVLANLDRHMGKDGIVAAEVLWHANGDLPHFSYGRPEDGNLWLHFFEKLEFSEFPAARMETREYPADGPSEISSNAVYATYKLDRRWRSAYHALFTRHIRLKPHIAARVDTIMSPLAGQFRLGVHYRDPKHSVECLAPIPSPETFVDQALRILRWRFATAWPPFRLKDFKVVLASDYEPAVAAFRLAFGDALVTQSGVSRSTIDAKDQRHHGPPDAALGRGEEVLIDCLMLSRCDALLHVTSNVATTAGYINPRLKMIYCESLAEAMRGWRWSFKRMRDPTAAPPPLA